MWCVPSGRTAHVCSVNIRLTTQMVLPTDPPRWQHDTITVLKGGRHISYSDTVSWTRPMKPQEFCLVMSVFTLSSNYYLNYRKRWSIHWNQTVSDVPILAISQKSITLAGNVGWDDVTRWHWARVDRVQLVRCHSCLRARDFCLKISVSVSYTIQLLTTRNETYKKRHQTRLRMFPAWAAFPVDANPADR